MAKKDMTIKIGADQVMFSNISKSKDGYNSARVVAKVNDKEYMSVSYEWEGNNVTDLAMDFMSFMQANKVEIEAAVESHKDEMAAKKGKMPPWMNDDEEYKIAVDNIDSKFIDFAETSLKKQIKEANKIRKEA